MQLDYDEQESSTALLKALAEDSVMQSLHSGAAAVALLQPSLQRDVDGKGRVRVKRDAVVDLILSYATAMKLLGSATTLAGQAVEAEASKRALSDGVIPHAKQ